MRKYEDIVLKVPKVLLPKEKYDLQKWAVIACDQYTSEPEYWKKIEEFIGEEPSTLKIIFPEVYLEESNKEERIEKINSNMQKYIDEDIFNVYENFIYVEREANNKIRKGLIVALDLEKYNYNKGSQTLIRATEGTIISRLPPRIKVRENAPLESPHIMVLIDDPNKTVIEPLANKNLEKIYDFDLMMNSGKIKGFKVNQENEKSIVNGLRKLADKEKFNQKYPNKGVLLYAMGDGNHSLATAKAIWEKIKDSVDENHPARYALVELVNVHDDSLEFEPIHRVVFGLKKQILEEMKNYFGENLDYQIFDNKDQMISKVKSSKHGFGMILNNQYYVFEIKNPKSNLPVGTLQEFLDKFLEEKNAESLDYVHGEKIVCELGNKENNVGFYLPSMSKADLFKTVILDGSLPRKTFSMGEAEEKRFYLECRKIK